MHFYMLHLIYVFKLTKKILQVLFMLWLSICITITCISRILKSFLADWFSLIFDLNGFKGDQRPKLHPCFYGIFLLVSRRERESPLQSFVTFWSVFTKLWGCKVLDLMWLISYLQMYITLHSLLSLHIFVYFMKKEPFTKPYVFNHFSVTCEVTNIWWIKLWINASDVITTKEQTKYANWGLHVILWNFWLMSYCFKMKKDFFMQKMLLWPQVPFKSRVNRHSLSLGSFWIALPYFFDLFSLLFLVTPYLVVAAQPCMKWIPIFEKISLNILINNYLPRMFWTFYQIWMFIWFFAVIWISLSQWIDINMWNILLRIDTEFSG